MEDTKHLILSILKFFDDQQRSVDLTPDAIESLEVATQCLESAYGISIRDVDAVARYPLPGSLPEIFSAGLGQLNIPAASTADRESAERLKAEGNEFMRVERYDAAIDCYTRAIQLDRRNAVYYSNRAAAYGKAGEQQKAIDDCKSALAIDPKYSKAFSRKGLAHSALGQHREARDCFKKALELDPTNDSYRDNLRQAEQSVREADQSGGAGSGVGGLNIGGMDLSSLLNNPALMNMATSMLSNPQMQSMMANMMSTNAQAGEAAGGPQGISSLLQAGQQLAQQMQQQNPELVEQLRSQMKPNSDSKPDDDKSSSS